MTAEVHVDCKTLVMNILVVIQKTTIILVSQPYNIKEVLLCTDNYYNCYNIVEMSMFGFFVSVLSPRHLFVSSATFT